MLIEKLPLIVDGQVMYEAVIADFKNDPAFAHQSHEQCAISGLAYVCHYLARLNQARIDAGDIEVRPLTESEVDELLVNVSIAKLEKLLAERKAQQVSH